MLSGWEGVAGEWAGRVRRGVAGGRAGGGGGRAAGGGYFTTRTDTERLERIANYSNGYRTTRALHRVKKRFGVFLRRDERLLKKAV